MTGIDYFVAYVVIGALLGLWVAFTATRGIQVLGTEEQRAKGERTKALMILCIFISYVLMWPPQVLMYIVLDYKSRKGPPK